MTPRQTKKYVAAKEAIAALPSEKKRLAPYGTRNSIAEETYRFLEELGWWWNAKAGEWSKELQPSTSIFKRDDGLASGAFRIRLMAHPDEMEEVVELVVEAMDTYGVQVIETSEPYPNHRGPGVRVYITCMRSR